MIIRKATQNDISTLAAIHVSAWQTAYKNHMPQEYLNQISIEKRISNWQEWIDTPGPRTTFVIGDDENLIGFCIFGPVQKDKTNDLHTYSAEGEILSLNIHPENWRCGYGKQLCLAVIQESVQRQWKNLSLWTLKSNEPAKRFYQTLEFSSTGISRIVKLSDSIFVDELYFNKILS